MVYDKGQGILEEFSFESIPECSLAQYLLEKLKLHPRDQILQVDSETGATQTTGEFLKACASLAKGLMKIEVRENDVVALLSRNSLEASQVVFATWLLGAIIAPVNGSMKLRELEHALNLIKPKIIFCEKEMLSNVCSALSLLAATATIIITDKFEGFESACMWLQDVVVEAENCEPCSISSPSTQLAAILPSSGTSGLPKAVGITHRNFIFQDMTLNFVRGFKEGSDCLQISHFFWVTGMLSFIRSLSTGMKRILIKHVNSENVLRTIELYKPEWTLTAPLFLVSVSSSPDFERFDVSSLKTVLLGGSPFSPAIAEKIKKKWSRASFVQVYGTTEASGIVTTTSKDGDVFSLGKVVPGLQLKIVDLESGEIKKPYVPGEIRIKTPGAMKCYVGNPEATSQTFDSQGWILTGDIGYCDSSGQVYLVDRLKEMVKIMNMQVAPAEIENAIMGLTGVAEAGVTAVSATEDSSHFILVAFVVKEKNSSLTEKDICLHVETTLSEYKKLTGGVYFVESLPKTASGKIARDELSRVGSLNRRLRFCCDGAIAGRHGTHRSSTEFFFRSDSFEAPSFDCLQSPLEKFPERRSGYVMAKACEEKKSKWLSESEKWLATDSEENKTFYDECNVVYKSSKLVVANFKNLLINTKKYHRVDKDLLGCIDLLPPIVEGMRKISIYATANSSAELEKHKMFVWKRRLFFEKLAISKLTNDLVLLLLDHSEMDYAFRSAQLCNEIVALNLSGESKNINVFSNSCPILLHPLRKLSANRILQILASRRAESCSFNFIFRLLKNYFEPAEEDVPVEGLDEGTTRKADESKLGDAPRPSIVRQNSASSNTSVEIYRALTRHLEKKAKEGEDAANESVDALLRSEEKRIRVLFGLCARVAPRLLGADSVVPSKTSGCPRVKSSFKNNLTEYYRQVLWGEVGGYLEHILLWWNMDPLGSFPPSLCQNLKEYICRLKKTDFIPYPSLPSVNSLLDAMCCHLTATSWDQLFRKTLVSAGTVKRDVYRDYGIEGSATGQLFVEMLEDLIKLNNSCENLHETLEELPLVEQIPILHRLDHSVHMLRLWSSSRCRHLAAKWNLDEFYCTCHTDISKSLHALNALKLTDHENVPSGTSVQVTVCIKMRAKLISEIRENIEKLKKTTRHCIEILAKNCRTQCLAVLHMSFPDSDYWKRIAPLSDSASDYVDKYLNFILLPVFAATRKMSREIQQSSSSMILRILCESWLEYVYLHRIKFSEWGAVQLLTDFGAVPTWLVERVQLPKDLLQVLISHEVLRRCEGVGRLLLRRRGESIAMTSLHESSEEDSAVNNMPAEMYVPNQEQWLDLRAPINNNKCCRL